MEGGERVSKSCMRFVGSMNSISLSVVEGERDGRGGEKVGRGVPMLITGFANSGIDSVTAAGAGRFERFASEANKEEREGGQDGGGLEGLVSCWAGSSPP